MGMGVRARARARARARDEVGVAASRRALSSPQPLRTRRRIGESPACSSCAPLILSYRRGEPIGSTAAFRRPSAMDPWADSGEGETSAGPSWGSARQSSPSPPLPREQPPRLAADTPSHDPWAESSFSATGAATTPEASAPHLPQPASTTMTATAQQQQQQQQSSSIGDDSISGIGGTNAASDRATTQDFDPWGGGSVPVAPSSVERSRDHERPADAHNSDDDNPYGSADPGYRSTSLNGRSQDYDAGGWGGGSIDPGIFAPGDADLAPAAVDDDDPWGSGAAARRQKAEKDAEAVSWPSMRWDDARKIVSLFLRYFCRPLCPSDGATNGDSSFTRRSTREGQH